MRGLNGLSKVDTVVRQGRGHFHVVSQKVVESWIPPLKVTSPLTSGMVPLFPLVSYVKWES